MPAPILGLLAAIAAPAAQVVTAIVTRDPEKAAQVADTVKSGRADKAVVGAVLGAIGGAAVGGVPEAIATLAFGAIAGVPSLGWAIATLAGIPVEVGTAIAVVSSTVVGIVGGFFAVWKPANREGPS